MQNIKWSGYVQTVNYIKDGHAHKGVDKNVYAHWGNKCHNCIKINALPICDYSPIVNWLGDTHHRFIIIPYLSKCFSNIWNYRLSCPNIICCKEFKAASVLIKYEIIEILGATNKKNEQTELSMSNKWKRIYGMEM